MKKQVVLITGASSGIGKVCAEYLCSKKYKVYGTTRNKANITKENQKDDSITMIYLDVTDSESISQAVGKVIKDSGYIDVVINNAGMGMAGSLEDSTNDDVIKQFSTNVFGAINVINEVLPHMRKAKSGLIINIGSVAGYIPIPYQGVYSATKAAMFSLTCSLRNEIRQFGLNACIVQPGDTKTSFTANRKMTEKSISGTAYENRMKHSIGVMEKDEMNGKDPISVAKTIYKVMKRKNPPVAITVGFKYKMVAFLFRIVPVKLREAIIASLYA
ncbi:MAG: SDR family oxidoreductase [Clostridiales bacterium]|nr:SDR family oxidoreductase [Clostridiales bacterium]